MLCSLHVIAKPEHHLSRAEIEKYIKKASYKGDFAMTEAGVSKHLKLMYEAGKGRNYEKS